MAMDLALAMDLAIAIKDDVEKIDAPFVKAYISTLGGMYRAAVMVTVSLDPRAAWANGILENSRYAKFDIDTHDKSVRMISGGSGLAKFRKTRWKTADDAVAKLAKWVEAARCVTP